MREAVTSTASEFLPGESDTRTFISGFTRMIPDSGLRDTSEIT
jgi:hypothetical protein